MKPNKPHHYYRIPASTETGKSLQALIDKCNEVSETSRQWAEAQGATSYIESPEGIAGGIVALTPPDLPQGEENENAFEFEKWDMVETPHGDVFFLPKEGSDLEKEMYALPVVSETEFINILQFKPRLNTKGKRLPFTFGSSTPICFIYLDNWYVDMPYECQADGIEPIDEKEFYRRRLAAVNTNTH